MNIAKLITSLQQAALASTTANEYITLSKAIEKLNVGKVTTVSLISGLPTNLTTNGNLYFVTSESNLYYNTGSAWKLLNNFQTLVYTWGTNVGGQLGDNTTTNKSSPVTVVGGITTWSQLFSGKYHNLGITSTGIAYAWGYNFNGQLGDNTAVSKSSPVTVVGGITNWSQVAGGQQHSLGLTSAGIAYAWGRNLTGQLGDNTGIAKLSPVTVVGGITTWSQLAAGSLHSLARTSTGVAYAWGATGAGYLGDNTAVSKSSPVTVVGGITNWSQVSGGDRHSLGRTATGTAYAWGNNTAGRLGDDTIANRSSPVTVVGGITTWSQLAGGTNHSVGLTSTGIAYGWGGNLNGQLGDNTTVSKSSPVTVVGGITTWSQLATSGISYHSVGLTNAGVAYAWGLNSTGQLGDNTTVNKSSPVTVVSGITTWSQLYAGTGFSLGLITTAT